MNYKLFEEIKKNSSKYSNNIEITPKIFHCDIIKMNNNKIYHLDTLK